MHSHTYTYTCCYKHLSPLRSLLPGKIEITAQVRHHGNDKDKGRRHPERAIGIRIGPQELNERSLFLEREEGVEDAVLCVCAGVWDVCGMCKYK